MTTIADIMTRGVAAVSRDETLQTAARRMREMDVGALPVTDGRALAGMVTDRDIAIRGVAQGLNPEVTPVASICSKELITVSPEDHIDSALPFVASSMRAVPMFSMPTTITISRAARSRSLSVDCGRAAR